MAASSTDTATTGSKAPNISEQRKYYTRRHSTLNLGQAISSELDAPVRFMGESSHRQTIIFLLSLAVNRIFPDRQLVIQSNYSWSLHSRSYYARFVNHSCSSDDIKKLKTEVKNLIKMEIPIIPKYMEYKECINHFTNTKQLYSAKLVETLNQSRYKVAGCEINNKSFYVLQYRPFLSNSKFSPNFELFYDDTGSMSNLKDEFDDIDTYDESEFDENKENKENDKADNTTHHFVVAFPSRSNPNGDILKPKISTSVRKLYLQGVKIGKMLELECVGDLNKIIQENRKKELLLLSEAYHDMQIVNIARNILKKKKETKGKLKVILISGPSSSGKTTFASKLCVQLKLLGLNPVSMEVDMYYREHSDPDYPRDPKSGELNFETIDAMRLDFLQESLKKLFNGETVNQPNFSLGQGKVIGISNKITLPKNGILVMEGIFCLNPKLTSSISNDFKFSIFMCPISFYNLDDHNFLSEQVVRLIRRVSRDYRHRDRAANKTLFKWGQLQGGEDENIFPFVENANCVFNSTLSYEVPVLKVFTKPLLQTVKPDDPHFKDAKQLIEFLNSFVAMPESNIPMTSIIKEFIDTSIYDDM